MKNGLAMCLIAITGACTRLHETTAPAPRVTQLRVLPTSLEMTVGDSATLVGDVAADVGIANRTVLWWSTDTLVATVDAGGRVVAKALGTATIVATVAADPTFKAIAVIGVLSDRS
jgi:uncharacterized protein YjdB